MGRLVFWMIISRVISATTLTIRTLQFDNQPAVGLWNLQRFAQTLSPFMDVDALNDALDSYQDVLLREYGTLMRNKLGLMTQEKGDNEILNDLFALMAREGSDYTRTFRMLGQTEQHSAASPLRDEFIDRQAFDDWFCTLPLPLAAGTGR